MRVLLIILALASGVAAARGAPLPADEAFRLSVSRDGGLLQLRWTIAEGHYLYTDHFGLEDAAGTGAVAFDPPRGKLKNDPSFGTVEVLHDEARISLGGALPPRLRVTYQGCEDGGICYRPEARIVDTATLAVAAAGPGETATTGIWSTAGGSSAESAGLTAGAVAGAGGASTEGSLVASLVAEGGWTWVIGSFLAFGVLLAGTPCVFPMYPIVAAALGREGERLTARRGFALSATYATFLALAFGLVGAVAGWTGENIQLALQSSWTLAAMCVLFVVLALSMFGAFEIRLPSSLSSRIAAATVSRRGSYRDMAVLGFSSVLVIGPCVTAPLAGALIYIAQSGDWRLGAAALFALGIGKCLPLIAFATFGSRILPRAGAWMERLKHLFGFAFLATAIWLGAPLLPPGVDLGLWSVLLIGIGAFVLTASAGAAGMSLVGARTAAGVAGLYAAMLAFGAATGGTDPLKPLANVTATAGTQIPEPDFAEVGAPSELAALTSSGGEPSLLYFTADWCTTCHVIERSVLSDREVRASLAPLRLVKADLSDITPGDDALMKTFDVVGPPTMIFLDRRGSEIPGTRLVGDVTARSLSERAYQAGGS